MAGPMYLAPPRGHPARIVVRDGHTSHPWLTDVVHAWTLASAPEPGRIHPPQARQCPHPADHSSPVRQTKRLSTREPYDREMLSRRCTVTR